MALRPMAARLAGHKGYGGSLRKKKRYGLELKFGPLYPNTAGKSPLKSVYKV